ncbi:MAG TPA: hypothetical protein VII75_15720 [Thermoanaerobaculia bacterium]|nr:hypothetical protein [Thermoanaerobaculia bacterium]
MKIIRFILWIALAAGYALASTIRPESDHMALNVTLIAGAIVEIIYRIKRKERYETAISPDPIESLNLTKRP